MAGADSTVSEEYLKDLSTAFDGPKETVLHALKDHIAAHRNAVDSDEQYQLRILKFLQTFKLNSIRKRKRVAKEEDTAGTDGEKAVSDELARNFYSQLVTEFLRCQLSRQMYIKFLLHVHDRIMPNMAKPLVLTDFLVASFAKGGLISVLSLSGLFALIQEHHLNFPQFYEHFYSLLTPEVLQSKYRARFFFLADRFMGSTHIPSYTIAAVAKRLSRLSLTAPVDSLQLILAFVMNLIIRHASLETLVHRIAEEEIDVPKDPYIFEEKDMMKCGAADSSLWELKSLQSHYCGAVSKLASSLDQRLPEVEFDITDHLECEVSDLVEDTLSQPLPENQTTKRIWSALFPAKSTVFGELWECS